MASLHAGVVRPWQIRGRGTVGRDRITPNEGKPETGVSLSFVIPSREDGEDPLLQSTGPVTRRRHFSCRSLRATPIGLTRRGGASQQRAAKMKATLK